MSKLKNSIISLSMAAVLLASPVTCLAAEPGDWVADREQQTQWQTLLPQEWSLLDDNSLPGLDVSTPSVPSSHVQTPGQDDDNTSGSVPDTSSVPTDDTGSAPGTGTGPDSSSNVDALPGGDNSEVTGTDGDGLPDTEPEEEIITREQVYKDSALEIYRYFDAVEQSKDGQWLLYDKLAEEYVSGWALLVDSSGNERILYYGGSDPEAPYMFKGEKIIGNETYSFGERTGKLFTGEVKLGERWHYLEPDTLEYKKSELYKHTDGRTVYYNSFGYLVYGWYLIDGINYYFSLGNGASLTGEIYASGKWYYLDPITREIASGLTQLPDGRWVYYAKVSGDNYPSMRHGTVRINGVDCEFSKVTGALRIGETKKDDDGWYNFDFDNWRWITGLYTLPDGRTVYYNSAGRMQYGRVSTNSGTYYFNEVTGAKMEPGEHYVNGGWKYLDSSTMNWYSGWRDLTSSRTVYYDKNGFMVYGQQTIDGVTYLFSSASGTLQTGEVRIDGYWKYLDKATRQYVTNRFYELPDGRTVYYDGNGRLQYGVVTLNGFPYSFDTATGALKYGEVYINGHWYYLKSDRTYATGLTQRSNKTYFYNEKGQMQYGMVKVDKTTTRYFDPHTGAMYEGTMQGIDVSSNQGNINWAAVKASGIDFVVLRVLAWDKKADDYKIDDNFLTYYKQAKAQGLMVGAYMYSYATSKERAVREVNFVYNSKEWQEIMKLGGLDLPLYLDYEDKYITANTSSYAQRTEIVEYAMVLIEQEARARGWSITPGFYANKSWSTTIFNGSQLQNQGYAFWLAYWITSGTPAAQHGWSPTPQMWQYTDKGTVPGIPTNVDRNVMNQ